MQPSGENHELRSGDQLVTVVEVGGGLRTFTARGREVIDGYREDRMCPSGRGQILAPWPNRLADGEYEFDGSTQHLPVDDPGTHSAIHGLVRWLPWAAVEIEPDRAVLGLTLHPRPGYPFELQLQVEYLLGDGGLEVTTTARNSCDAACPFGLGQHPYLRPAGATVDDAVVRVPARTRSALDERSLPLPSEPVAGEYDLREPRRLGPTVLDATYSDLVRDDDGLARCRVDETTVWLDEAYGHVQVFTGDPLPDVARRSLAVEPMTCAPNAFRSGEGLLRLEPGETFTGRWGIDPGRR